MEEYQDVTIDDKGLDKEMFIQLLEYAILTKMKQQSYDEYILSVTKYPLHCKWMQEVLVDQHKHENMLREIYRYYEDKEFNNEVVEHKVGNKNFLTHIEDRIEGIFGNISLFNKLSRYTRVDNVRDMLDEIALDEQVHAHKLSLMYKVR